jgi:hypothetical protein
VGWPTTRSSTSATTATTPCKTSTSADHARRSSPAASVSPVLVRPDRPRPRRARMAEVPFSMPDCRACASPRRWSCGNPPIQSGRCRSRLPKPGT